MTHTEHTARRSELRAVAGAHYVGTYKLVGNVDRDRTSQGGTPRKIICLNVERSHLYSVTAWCSPLFGGCNKLCGATARACEDDRTRKARSYTLRRSTDLIYEGVGNLEHIEYSFVRTRRPSRYPPLHLLASNFRYCLLFAASARQSWERSKRPLRK